MNTCCASDPGTDETYLRRVSSTPVAALTAGKICKVPSGLSVSSSRSTSAESELSIADIRKALASLRRGWEEVLIDPRSKPLYLSSSLPLLSNAQGIRMEDFALRFVLAHHQKRHSGSCGTA